MCVAFFKYISDLRATGGEGRCPRLFKATEDLNQPQHTTVDGSKSRDVVGLEHRGPTVLFSIYTNDINCIVDT